MRTLLAITGLAAVLVSGVTMRMPSPAEAVPVNVAPTGVASQSSTGFIRCGGLGSGPAARGIDGNRLGTYDVGVGSCQGSVTHTNQQTGAFWEVQLPDDVEVETIIVFNRTDCCEDRIDPFRASLFDGATETFGVIVPVFTNDINEAATTIQGDIINVGGAVGDRVRITLVNLDGSLRNNFLHLAEVEVLVEPAQVPGPATAVLLLGGLAAITVRRWRRAAGL